MQDIQKRNIKIVCKNKNKQPLRLNGYHRATNRSFFVDNAKRILQWRDPVPPEKVAVIDFNRSRSLANDMGKEWYTEFAVWGTLESADKLTGITDPGFNAEANKFNLLREFVAKMHNLVSWRDKDNKKLNTNCTEVVYEIIDEEALAERGVDDVMLYAKCLNYINTAFAQDDKIEFKEMVYGFGLGQFWAGDTINQIFVKLTKKVEMNPRGFLEFIDNPDRELETVIFMALEGANGVKEMTKVGETYYIGDSFPIGNSLAQAKAHLKGDLEQYERLYKLYMGKKKDGKTGTVNEQEEQPAKRGPKAKQEEPV